MNTKQLTSVHLKLKVTLKKKNLYLNILIISSVHLQP